MKSVMPLVFWNIEFFCSSRSLSKSILLLFFLLFFHSVCVFCLNSWSHGLKHFKHATWKNWICSSSFSFTAGLSEAETLVTVRKVTHLTVQEPLAGSVLLPCVHTLPLGSSHQDGTLHVRWTRLEGATETTVLSLENGEVRVQRAYEGRISLPGYDSNSLNVSLALSQLRTNDSGTFLCHVILGDTYEQDTVTLEVTGEIFFKKWIKWMECLSSAIRLILFVMKVCQLSKSNTHKKN